MTDWSIGSYNKTGIWLTYILFNYVGVILCTRLIYKIKNKDMMNSFDVFLIGLLSGCIWMSITCGTQCLISVIYGHFYGSDIACHLEAIFHISAILVQFFSVALTGLRNYLAINKQYIISTNKAIYTLIAMWLICIIVTILFSLISPIYLMSAGVYCFFEFKSPGIAGWLLPGLLMSLISLIYSYLSIVCYLRRFNRQMLYNNLSRNDEIQIKIAKRSTIYVLTLLIGWLPAAITSIYELTTGQATQIMVITVGVAGTFHSILVPLVYGCRNSNNRPEPNTEVGDLSSPTVNNYVMSSLTINIQSSNKDTPMVPKLDLLSVRVTDIPKVPIILDSKTSSPSNSTSEISNPPNTRVSSSDTITLK